MGRRKTRRDQDWAPLVMMGLAALASLFRGGRRPVFEMRRSAPSPFRPLVTVIMLVGAFIMLGGLLTVLSIIAAFGNGGALLAVCALPLMFIAFIAWFVSQRSRPQVKVDMDAHSRTIDAMPGEVHHSPPAAEAVQPRTETWLPPFVSRTEPGGSRRPSKADLIERPARTPAEYRQRAASYRRKIQSLIKTRRPGPIAERMSGVLQKLKNWEERVGQLADRLTLYENDDLIQRDVRETPGHIARLQRQLSLEADPEMQRQIRRTVSAYQEQQRQLQLLGRVMKRSRLNLDDTLAAMGTVYSQLQVLNAMDIDGPTAARIASDVDREVERLNDLMTAMSDVYAQSGEISPQSSASTGDDDAGIAGRKARLGGSTAN